VETLSQHLTPQLPAKVTKPVENFETVIKGLTLHVFPRRALSTQKRCMRRFFRKPIDMTMQEFMARVVEINELMAQYPPNFNENQKLPNDEILDIGEFAMPNSWQQEMTRQDFDPQDVDINALVAFCERMEATEEAPPKMKNESEKIPKKSKRARTEGSKWCEYCDMNNHNTKDCGHLHAYQERTRRTKISQQENEVE
jgi:hypothetical protein